MKANFFKVGEKVKVKKYTKRPFRWNIEGKMDHLMGNIVEITEVTKNGLYIIYDPLYNKTWAFEDKDLEPLKECIVIYRKNNKVIAVDKDTGKKAIARCCPEDTFDFHVGAKLAFKRLVGEMESEPAKTPLNAKIVFTRGDSIFNTGHIYEIEDGKLKNPIYGDLLPIFFSFCNMDEVKDYFTKTSDRTLYNGIGWSAETLEFIEVKED